MEHTWIVSVARSKDWQPFQVALICRLLDRGLSVRMGYMRWEVEVSEWVQYVSAVASVWAEFSRWSEHRWLMSATYTVRIRRNDQEGWRYVWMKVDNGGVRYGSLAC